jgi:hypothetical protein
MITHLLRKDWKLLWPMVAFVTLIQACREWVTYKGEIFSDDATAAGLLGPLTLAWFVGIGALAVAVVQQDAVPGVDQDWLIRPLKRTELLLAKVLFVALTVSLPMLLLDLAHASAAGFPLTATLGLAAYKELYVIVCLVIPVMALAAATGGMTELIVLGGALIAVFATALSVYGVLGGPNSCPTCDSGVAWLQHLLRHMGILFGAVLILCLQYYRRATRLSRALAVVGALVIVFAQLPWQTAFAIQRTLSPALGAAAGIDLSFEPQLPLAEKAPSSAGRPPIEVGQATHALLHGSAGDAVKYLQGRRRSGNPPIRIELPVRMSGIFADEVLLVDHSELDLTDESGTRVYRSMNSDVLVFTDAESSVADSGESTRQAVDIPIGVFQAIGLRTVRLRMKYSLTLMKVITRHLIAAQNGELQAVDMGRCATRIAQDGASIQMHCIHMGSAPFCLSATLYGPGERHNPEVLSCDPDYRPYLPSLTDLVGSYSLDVPIRDRFDLAQYPVDPSELERSYLLIKIYAVRDHFTRLSVIPRAKLAEWKALAQ